MRWNVSCETLRQSKKLQFFANNFYKWQKHINLTATNEDLWQRHIAQSIRILDFFPQNSTIIADFGSGGGFPGLVAAIYYQEQTADLESLQFHLVESDQRKASFLRETARLTGTKIILHVCRIEELAPQKFDVITARALAPLTKLFNYSVDFMHQDSLCLFYKGKNYQIELTEALKKWNMHYKIIPLLQQSTFILACKEISC